MGVVVSECLCDLSKQDSLLQKVTVGQRHVPARVELIRSLTHCPLKSFILFFLSVSIFFFFSNPQVKSIIALGRSLHQLIQQLVSMHGATHRQQVDTITRAGTSKGALPATRADHTRTGDEAACILFEKRISPS